MYWIQCVASIRLLRIWKKKSFLIIPGGIFWIKLITNIYIQACDTALLYCTYQTSMGNNQIIHNYWSKEQKHKQKKIPRCLGKDLNSYASEHNTVCGLRRNFPCGQVVSVTTYCGVSGMKLANFIKALLKKVDNLSDPACPLCTHMKNESLLYYAYHEEFCLL